MLTQLVYITIHNNKQSPAIVLIKKPMATAVPYLFFLFYTPSIFSVIFWHLFMSFVTVDFIRSSSVAEFSISVLQTDWTFKGTVA